MVGKAACRRFRTNQHDMKRCAAIAFCLLGLVSACFAQDITKLEKIGPVANFTKSEKSVLFNCQDNSQVQLTILSPDLVRVRASFGKAA